MLPEHAKGLIRYCTISKSAFTENLRQISARFGTQVALDLSGDAYGHGESELEALARSAGFTNFVREAAFESETTALLYGFGEGVPAHSLFGEVVHVRRVEAGVHVSYGYTYTTSKPTTLALVALGFADGLPRAASNLVKLQVAGKEVSSAGRIAMDQLVFDDPAEVLTRGSVIELWGKNNPIAIWAKASSMLPQEITARVSQRVSRRWVD